MAVRIELGCWERGRDVAGTYHRTYVYSYKKAHLLMYIKNVTMREYTFFTELQFRAEPETLLVDLSKDLKSRIMQKMGLKGDRNSRAQIADNIKTQLTKKGLIIAKCRGTFMLNPEYANKQNYLSKYNELMDVYLKMKRGESDNVIEFKNAKSKDS